MWHAYAHTFYIDESADEAQENGKGNEFVSNLLLGRQNILGLDDTAQNCDGALEDNPGS